LKEIAFWHVRGCACPRKPPYWPLEAYIPRQHSVPCVAIEILCIHVVLKCLLSAHPALELSEPDALTPRFVSLNLRAYHFLEAYNGTRHKERW